MSFIVGYCYVYGKRVGQRYPEVLHDNQNVSWAQHIHKGYLDRVGIEFEWVSWGNLSYMIKEIVDRAESDSGQQVPIEPDNVDFEAIEALIERVEDEKNGII
jgi:hypothetical protein